MHTVKYARQQKKILACYYGRMVDFAEGNQSLGKSKSVIRLEEEYDLDIFLNSVEGNNIYQQLTLSI